MLVCFTPAFILNGKLQETWAVSILYHVYTLPQSRHYGLKRTARNFLFRTFSDRCPGTSSSFPSHRNPATRDPHTQQTPAPSRLFTGGASISHRVQFTGHFIRAISLHMPKLMQAVMLIVSPTVFRYANNSTPCIREQRAT
jgi:hypothetical protein